MSDCTVFFLLTEYALVNILMGDIIDGEESALKKGMKSMFMTSGSTRMSSASQQVYLHPLSLRFHLSPIPFCFFFQKMLEVQQQQQQPASRCLRHNSTAAGSGGNNNQQQPMIRSQSMMATGSSAGSCHSHPQQPRCRQHHAAEIHHLDDGQPQPQRERLLVPQQSGRGPRHSGASNTSSLLSTLSICPLLPPPSSMDEAHFFG